MQITSFQPQLPTRLARFFLACLLGVTAATSAQAREEITVLADSNLLVPLVEISRNYARQTDAVVSVVLNTSSSPTERIRGGLPVDVVLTSSASTRNMLNLSGQVDQTASTAFAKDQLVIATSKTGRIVSGEQAINQLLSGVQQPVLVLIDGESDPMYKQASEHAMAGTLDPAPKIVIVPDMTTALYELKAQGSFMLLPRSVALSTPELAIQSIVTSEQAENVTTYYADVLASDHMSAARVFTRFLLTDMAQNILARHGYTKP